MYIYRYKGKKVSSKQIFNEDKDSDESQDAEEDEESVNSEFDDEDQEEKKNGRRKKYSESISEDTDGDSADDNNSNEGTDEDADEDADEDVDEDANEDTDEDGEEDFDDMDDDIDLSNPLRRDRGSQKDIKTMTTTNVRGEIEKGNCVREQLKLWENLLEMRIKVQKCLITSNKMPQFDVYKNYESNSELKKNYKVAKSKLGSLLNNLLELQNNLLSNFPETKGILNKGKKRKLSAENELEKDEDDSMNEEIPSDSEDEINSNAEGEEKEQEELEEGSEDEDERHPAKKLKLSEFENVLARNHKAYSGYRDSVIQKWNDKTRIASGVISKGPNQPVLKQIEYVMGSKEKVIKKTQLKRSEYDIIGKSAGLTEEKQDRREQEYDGEIYDDDDFYHQLLRELIEYKSSDITDPIQLSKQWIKLQSMRTKMKRKIDTRATKGRRIRYNVHQKLVNFMGPISVNDSWTDHAKDELYSSIFGKSKSSKKQDSRPKEEVNKAEATPV